LGNASTNLNTFSKDTNTKSNIMFILCDCFFQFWFYFSSLS